MILCIELETRGQICGKKAGCSEVDVYGHRCISTHQPTGIPVIKLLTRYVASKGRFTVFASFDALFNIR